MLKEAIAMLMQNKNARAEFQSGQLQFAGLGAMEQRALKEVFKEGRNDRVLKNSNILLWEK
ncbi:competence pheromone ComX [Saccharibacillus sacchari]|uniref:competence pheromone ComX n=1 Tax=Saccharibacillus sacchari TaxID=456493 RepID=UPI0004B375EA|nr:competence pheromone ComX [Saccharibacillus sacchari]